MAIDHEAHKIRIKAVSDRMNHPMTYNDAGAPRMDMPKVGMEKEMRRSEDMRRGEERVPGARYDLNKKHG
jgi:hypothetical protein